MGFTCRRIFSQTGIFFAVALTVTACSDQGKPESNDQDLQAQYEALVKYATEDWSEEERDRLYRYRNQNEPRITLAPDLPGMGEEGSVHNTDPNYSYGLKGDYKFSIDWFSRKSPAWEVALADFAGKPDVQYLEVGVYEGRSVVWMLENILTDPTSHVTGIDIFYVQNAAGEGEYSPAQRDLYESNVIAAGGEGRFTTITEFSQTALRKLPLNYYDIIYIDGSHFAPSVLEDAILSLRLLKEGGILIFDDYRWWPGAARIKSPRYAIDIFLEMFADQLEVLHTESQVIVRRKKLDNKSIGLDAIVAEDAEAT